MAETMHELVCEECGVEFTRSSRQLSSSRCKGVKNFFCTRSCGVSFNNKHYGHGDKRSFIEKWLESRIKEKFPGLLVKYNDKETIGSELDMFIPLFNLAIELQGKAHYENVWGQDILEATQKNDEEKRRVCKEKGIELIEINMSKMNAVKRDPEFMKITDQVFSLIDGRLKI